jgi:PAS domain-containing protein
MNVAGQVSLKEAWPLHEKERHFELGSLLSCAVTDAVPPKSLGELGVSHAGCWECNLSDNSRLLWSGGVYDIFGLPRDAKVARDDAVRFYAEHSRAAMERLRDHAIRHQQGFTLDAEIRPATGKARWIRLIAAPVCVEGEAVRLHGIKLII